MKNILALAPHTDDIELGCGGFLSRLKEEGAHILVVSFSYSKDVRDDDSSRVKDECMASMDILEASWDAHDLPTRELPAHRQVILDLLVRLQQTNFDLVLCPSTYDQHQDHQTVQQEAFRAFKHTTILGYELPWNCRKFSSDVFVKLEQRHLDKKVVLLDCYKSQQQRPFMCKQYVMDIARMRGLQIGHPLAECFELIRGVI